MWCLAIPQKLLISLCSFSCSFLCLELSAPRAVARFFFTSQSKTCPSLSDGVRAGQTTHSSPVKDKSRIADGTVRKEVHFLLLKLLSMQYLSQNSFLISSLYETFFFLSQFELDFFPLKPKESYQSRFHKKLTYKLDRGKSHKVEQVETHFYIGQHIYNVFPFQSDKTCIHEAF